MAYNYSGQLSTESGRARYIFNTLRQAGIPASNAAGILTNFVRVTNGVTFPFYEWTVDTGPAFGAGIRGAMWDASKDMIARYHLGSNALNICRQANQYARAWTGKILTHEAERYMHQKMSGTPYPIPPDCQVKDVIHLCQRRSELMTQQLSGHDASCMFRKLNNPKVNLYDSKGQTRWERHGAKICQLLGLSVSQINSIPSDFMADGGVGGVGGGVYPPHNWPDFNIKNYAIMSDEKGRYTREPLMMGIMNHLQIDISGGSLGDAGGSIIGAGGGLGLLSVNGISLILETEGWTGGSRKTALTQPATASQQSIDRNGVITVGPGCTNLACPEIKAGQSYTPEQILGFFSRELNKKSSDLKRVAPNVLGFGQGAIDAAISYMYNCGTGGFQKLNPQSCTTREQFANAIANGAKTANGKVLPGLVKRRSAESNIVRGINDGSNEYVRVYFNPSPLAREICQRLGATS